MPRLANSPTRSRTDAETFGQRIAPLRKQLGELYADRTGRKCRHDQAVISSYECGRVRPHAAMIGQLAQALGVTADELLGLAETQTPKANGFSRRVLRRCNCFGGNSQPTIKKPCSR